MRRHRLLRVIAAIGMIGTLVLTGCARGNANTSSVQPGGQPAPQIIQAGPSIDPTLGSGLDQLDSQLNAIQKTLDAQDTLQDFK